MWSRILSGDEHCGEIADVAFIIDSSRSIWIYDFQRQLRFVQQLVKSFDVGPNRTHIAALTFSHFVEHELYFEQYQNAESIVDAVSFSELLVQYIPEILGRT